MRLRAPLIPLLLLLAFPPAVSAQGFALGARAGTLGFGAEAALSLSENLVARGGLGSFIIDYEGEFDGVDYTVTPPSLTATLGLDFYPTGSTFRLMAGLLLRSGDFEMESGDLAQAGGVDIGDETYTESGTLEGALSTNSTAPFLGLGFGHHTRGGFGFFLDLGVAFVGDPKVTMEGKGAIASVPGFRQELDKEVQQIEDDAGSYLKYWPILSLGVKIPIK
jgi:hypothetical protein